MDYMEELGFSADQLTDRKRLIRYVMLKLIAHGLPHPADSALSIAEADAQKLMASYHERLRHLHDIRCPADRRIEEFLESHLSDVQLDAPLRLPDQTVILDKHGLARELSLPVDGDSYSNAQVSSYRVRNGVLHNPIHDRRTTSGTFHVTEGGLPIPADKKSVPQQTFAALFAAAMKPPADSLQLPFTAECDAPAESFVSLLLRPLVCPEVSGFTDEKRLEIRFFAPGSLVSNLDFVESIFGNGGDPFSPENDAGLDIDHWTGHTGCVILAPHLIKLRKVDVGLPHVDDATERQRRDGMCWTSEDECYNDGSPFKLTCRSADGVIVTLIADNYFGYCKKEVKTQISYSANLFGYAEEEHAGGAIAIASFNLGREFNANSRRYNNRTFEDVASDYGDTLIDVKPEGYAVDRNCETLVYIPESARASVDDQTISWTNSTGDQSIPLMPGTTYMTPSGYKIRIEKHPTSPAWRLIGTMYEGVFCHKPCTVSGGGKSEISKSLQDYILHGPIFVADIDEDFRLIRDMFARTYEDRWRPDAEVQPDYSSTPSRKILDPTRSLGSVIKLLTPSPDYTQEYNDWLRSIPSHIYALVFIIKRFSHGEDGEDWENRFYVDIVNGSPGHELKFDGRQLVGDYLRVGFLRSSAWRAFKLRQDFAPAEKIQTEDDISASVVVPSSKLNHIGNVIPAAQSYKFVRNCEFRLFQRPDDAVHRGLDKQCEADLARADNFIVNFEPLSREHLKEICERPVDLSKFTAPMQDLMKDAYKAGDGYVVSSATPRIVDGKPSKNPRYLQNRPDLMKPMQRHVAEMGSRLYRAIPADQPVHIPVHAVLFGRRNNPPDYAKGIRPLAVYNPLHYQELPELFMDFVSSLTGKSPSTTGAGSEGALTKGPFNALLPVTDLNNALVSYLLTGLDGFSSAAGHIGADLQVDHDISLLIPEIWCRLGPKERQPEFLIGNGLMEKCEDFEHNGKLIPASRLGYRITQKFIRWFIGRIFDNPLMVFDEHILKPETQGQDAFADGILYIAEAHERVAKQYLTDGSIELACPPLKALLHVMAKGDYEGMTLESPALRQMFTLEAMLESDWYAARLSRQQKRDAAFWKRRVRYLEQYLADTSNAVGTERLELSERLEKAQMNLGRVSADDYADCLVGCLGADALEVN